MRSMPLFRHALVLGAAGALTVVVGSSRTDETGSATAVERGSAPAVAGRPAGAPAEAAAVDPEPLFLRYVPGSRLRYDVELEDRIEAAARAGAAPAGTRGTTRLGGTLELAVLDAKGGEATIAFRMLEVDWSGLVDGTERVSGELRRELERPGRGSCAICDSGRS